MQRPSSVFLGASERCIAPVLQNEGTSIGTSWSALRIRARARSALAADLEQAKLVDALARPAIRSHRASSAFECECSSIFSAMHLARHPSIAVPDAIAAHNAA